MQPQSINFRILLVLTTTFLLCQAAEAQKFQEEHFDFIIAGGGTAGCVLARRLTDSGEYNVLLLERGIVPHPRLDIPALSAATDNLEYVKIYDSVPQRNAGLRNGGNVAFTAGRMLGGTSSINAMTFNRGSRHDYDNWANITGDGTWGYDHMMKYFRRIEDYQGDFPSDQHGYGGPITITRPRYAPGLDTWLQAGTQLGYQILDPNGPQEISFTPIEFSRHFGRRVSSYAGYLKPVLGSRKNLKVIIRAVVTRVLLSHNRAIGVSYRLNGAGPEIHVRATHEVIISAGVIESPAILMRSGIGPKDVLLAVGISPVKYLPVGRNLHDHSAAALQIVISKKFPVYDPQRDLTPENFRIYNKTGEGPYSTYLGQCGQAFLASSLHEAEVRQNPSIPANWADIQFFHFSSSDVPGIIDTTNPVQTAQSEILINCEALVSRPKSRGSVTLNLKNIEGDPLIDFQYFSHPSDMSVMIDALKKALSTYEDTPAFRNFGAHYSSTPFPACSHLKFRSDEYWRCYIRQTGFSGLHGAGSCAMRGPGDPRAVVDSKLRVIGFKNLRVVDASVMPEVVNPNTQAAVYAIAEKAVEMILEDTSQ